MNKSTAQPARIVARNPWVELMQQAVSHRVARPYTELAAMYDASRTIGKKIRAIAPETVTLLIEHDWPGNVRELQNAMEHAVIVEKGPAILPSSLPSNLARSHDEEPSEWSAKRGYGKD
ncbi:MAG: hypothetical protein ACHBNF_16040 [Chromatiales bacterium]